VLSSLQPSIVCGCAWLIALAPVAAGAQVVDALVKGKSLYAEASYDDALRVLGTSQNAEAHQYRALCFLALGKVREAEGALEALITVSPEYAMSDADSPPRLLSLFAQTKKRMMPAIVRRLFGEARDDFQGKELERARGKFERVLALMRDPAVAEAPDLKDLQLLTTGYLEIVKNTPPPVPATPAPAVPVFSAPAPAVRATAPASAPVVSPAPPPVTPPPTGPKARTAAVVPAEIIRQTVPSYQPRPGQPVKALSGAVKVVIGTDGKVKTAAMDKSVDPLYDIRLVAAARSWTYKPATLDGRPIESEKIVPISVGQP
jgi:hypothetical protein